MVGKLLLLMCVLYLVSCGVSDIYNLIGYRRFSVGDCLIVSNREPEEWQKNKPSYIVLELGKKAYRIQLINSTIEDTISYGHLWEDFYQKVNCNVK